MFDTCPAHLRRVSALGLFESYTVELMKLEGFTLEITSPQRKCFSDILTACQSLLYRQGNF